uniref:BZIP domain-containing protein n=1 Tax=Panagrolaimus sp. PS1159 TaxID=55785 RepID=A0AC35GVH6_9BILA
MSIRFLTKQEPSTFTEDVQSPTTTTNPWIRLDVKQEVSEFSYIPIQQQRQDATALAAFSRPPRSRNSRPPLPPPPQPIIAPSPIQSFEDVIEAIRTGRTPSVDHLKKANKRYTPYSLESNFDRIRPSSSSRSSSHSDSRCSSVELGSGKKYSLSSLSSNEVKERKKEQNILAARRYRQRRNELLNERREEIEKLEKRKTDLQILEASLAGQIQALKDLFAEQLKQRVSGAISPADTKESSKHSTAVQACVDDIEVDSITVVEKEMNAEEASVGEVDCVIVEKESEKELAVVLSFVTEENGESKEEESSVEKSEIPQILIEEKVQV